MPTTHPTSLITNHLKSAPLAEPQLSRPPGGSPRVIQSLQVQMANSKNVKQKSHMAFKSVAVLQMTLKKNINTRCIISKVWWRLPKNHLVLNKLLASQLIITWLKRRQFCRLIRHYCSTMTPTKQLLSRCRRLTISQGRVALSSSCLMALIMTSSCSCSNPLNLLTIHRTQVVFSWTWASSGHARLNLNLRRPPISCRRRKWPPQRQALSMAARRQHPWSSPRNLHYRTIQR